MNNHISSSQVRQRLDEQNIRYRIQALPAGYHIIIMELSGRIFGPYKNDADEGIFWTNQVFEDKDKFENFIHTAGEWCFGGDRIWVTPEFPFF